MGAVAVGSYPKTPLDYALAYAARGWHVIPCKGKLPLVEHGSHDGSRDAGVITAWFARWPAANIGIVCGAHSGIWALDVDPRNGGDDAFDKLTHTHGALPETATAVTGAKGAHYLFRWVPGMAPKKPAHGIDVIGSFRYILVEPSLHPLTNEKYQWEGEFDPLDGAPIADAPAWLMQPEQPESLTAPRIAGTGYLSPARLIDLRSALLHLDADDYENWIRVGQCLHASEASEAFEIWDTWSQRSNKYRNGDTFKKWNTFKPNGGLNVESIFTWAFDAGWEGERALPELPSIPIEEITPLVASAMDIEPPPSALLRLPGALGLLVDYANRTAPKPQPLFAITTALAFGAVVLSRRWTTELDTWSPLYFCNVGKSASGKEHGRKVLERALAAAKLEHLLGPSGYTSDGAVFSSLMQQPAHITIIDELGEYLAAAKSEGNFHRRQAMTMLMEVWGRAGGTVRPQGYSTLSLSRAQAGEMGKRKIERPALSLLGMTTPEIFYNTLDDSSVRNGFLNRLLIVESHIGRQGFGVCESLPVPEQVIAWAIAARTACAGNLSEIDVASDTVPIARVVPITPAARRAWEAYASDCLASMDALERYGLAELEGRSAEKVMRIAMILAVSKDAEAPVIGVDEIAWARLFVEFATRQTIAACQRRMHATKFGAVKESIYETIVGGGEKGRTERELSMYSRAFAGMNVRERVMVLQAIEHEGRIAKTAAKSPRGRDRVAWVAVQGVGDD